MSASAPRGPPSPVRPGLLDDEQSPIVSRRRRDVHRQVETASHICGGHRHDPFQAPGTNVQIIVVEAANAPGFNLVLGSDAYYWNETRWWGCDMPGMYDYLFEHLGPQKTIFGRTMRTAKEFDELVARAMKEGLG